MLTTEEIKESIFQRIAEADDASDIMKDQLKQANERGISVLAYITETGPEVREILERMLADVIKKQVEERRLINKSIQTD